MVSPLHPSVQDQGIYGEAITLSSSAPFSLLLHLPAAGPAPGAWASGPTTHPQDELAFAHLLKAQAKGGKVLLAACTGRQVLLQCRGVSSGRACGGPALLIATPAAISAGLSPLTCRRASPMGEV